MAASSRSSVSSRSSGSESRRSSSVAVYSMTAASSTSSKASGSDRSACSTDAAVSAIRVSSGHAPFGPASGSTSSLPPPLHPAPSAPAETTTSEAASRRTNSTPQRTDGCGPKLGTVISMGRLALRLPSGRLAADASVGSAVGGLAALRCPFSRGDEPPSSSGLGRRPFKAVTGIRTPLGARNARSCGAVWSARRPVKAEAAGSNPVRTASCRELRARGRERSGAERTGGSGERPEGRWQVPAAERVRPRKQGRVAQLAERAPESARSPDRRRSRPRHREALPGRERQEAPARRGTRTRRRPGGTSLTEGARSPRSARGTGEFRSP